MKIIVRRAITLTAIDFFLHRGPVILSAALPKDMLSIFLFCLHAPVDSVSHKKKKRRKKRSRHFVVRRKKGVWRPSRSLIGNVVTATVRLGRRDGHEGFDRIRLAVIAGACSVRQSAVGRQRKRHPGRRKRHVLPRMPAVPVRHLHLDHRNALRTRSGRQHCVFRRLRQGFHQNVNSFPVSGPIAHVFPLLV